MIRMLVLIMVTILHFNFTNSRLGEEATKKVLSVDEIKEIDAEEKLYVAQIASFPKSDEKRVISFGLFGTKEKYTYGAVHNMELASTYFPGWTCRYYVTSDVPDDIILVLKTMGAEIEHIPYGIGKSSGMFWRFMVAEDASVDRFIVRDVDSRLNSRDRIAVEGWIQSGYPVHILRDHINHCHVMNGGMWGAIKGAIVIPKMNDLIISWSRRGKYMADMHFLAQIIWPEIKEKQITHDSYCCDKFPNTKPFPTRRSKAYEHVGQVFDSHNNPRMPDIDNFIRGVPNPVNCRKQPEWIYG